MKFKALRAISLIILLLSSATAITLTTTSLAMGAAWKQRYYDDWDTINRELASGNWGAAARIGLKDLTKLGLIAVAGYKLLAKPTPVPAAKVEFNPPLEKVEPGMQQLFGNDATGYMGVVDQWRPLSEIAAMTKPNQVLRTVDSPVGEIKITRNDVVHIIRSDSDHAYMKDVPFNQVIETMSKPDAWKPKGDGYLLHKQFPETVTGLDKHIITYTENRFGDGMRCMTARMSSKVK